MALSAKEEQFYRDIHKMTGYLERVAKSLERIEKNTFIYIPTSTEPTKEDKYADDRK